MSLSEFDEKCLRLTIEVAEKSYADGSFPVGAVLAMNDVVLSTAGNERERNSSRVAHAENTLIIENAKAILEASKQQKNVKLYTSLEPCIQCLGAAVSNRINEIFFIQTDTIAGACNLKPENVGPWYIDNWPEIHHCPISDDPRKLLAKYCLEKMKSDTTGWYEKCYQSYSE